MDARREKISAFVVSYNRAAIIGTCLRALRFADEVIVVDKTSTDATPEIAARHADRVISVPWTPTADDTRAFAVAECAHDWIVFADDDEVFSPAAVRLIQREVLAPQAEVYAFPLRHYVLGVHDENAHYWPEHHVRMFRRGAVEFSATIHACVISCSGHVLTIPPETGACIHHLSHQDVAQWIEKSNRYTSCADRARVAHDGGDLIGFAHARIDHWWERTRDRTIGGYPQAVALLRATYDLIDRLKVWEEERGLDGGAAFHRLCADLDAAHAGRPPDRPVAREHATPSVEPGTGTEAALRLRLRDLRAQHDAMTAREDARLRELSDARDALRDAQRRAAEASAAAALACAEADRAATSAAASQAALRAIEASLLWRATAWPRSVARRWRARR